MHSLCVSLLSGLFLPSLGAQMKRAARLVALTEHMRGRKTGVTAEALAERFGVSVRTMYRDLETLQDATLPIRAERGRGGGYALDRDYFLPPVALSPAEAALCVLLIEHAIAMRQVPFTDTMHAALDKLRAALSASAQRALLTHIQTLHFTGVPALPSAPAVRRVIEAAFFSGHAVTLDYVGAKGPRRRRVRLRNVVMEGSLTLLNVTDIDDGAERQLRLDRLTAAAIVDDDSSGDGRVNAVVSRPRRSRSIARAGGGPRPGAREASDRARPRS